MVFSQSFQAVFQTFFRIFLFFQIFLKIFQRGAGYCTIIIPQRQRAAVFAAEQVADIQIATLPKLAIPLLSRIPLLGPVFFTQNILTYLAYLMIPATLFLLYRTSLGLTLRSTGENPVAVDVAGLNVNRIRFLTVLVAGAVSGLAGSFYTVGYLGMFTSNIIGGRGWIAFAICFLGNWSPRGAVLGTLAFGLADAVSIYIQAVSGSSVFPNELIIALPYILTILLTICRKNFNVPAKLGVPYSKES